jgi:hypothetical protein
MGALYLECSAMENINVDVAFDSLALHVIENEEQLRVASDISSNIKLTASRADAQRDDQSSNSGCCT